MSVKGGIDISRNGTTALVFTSEKVSAIIDFGNVAKSTSPVIKEYLYTDEELAWWGDANDFPQQVIKDVQKDTEIGPLLERGAELLYGGGLTWGIPSLEDRNKLIPLPEAEDNEVFEWCEKSNINRYLIEAATDMRYFSNVFVEIVTTLDKTKVAQICVQAAEDCRLSKHNKKGFSETCYINANWPDATVSDSNTVKLRTIDPYYSPSDYLKDLIKQTDKTNFIYHLYQPTPGGHFYQTPVWNGLRTSGWLAVSQAIPEFKKKLIENQLNIKYLVEISDQFWPTKYEDWSELPPEQKKEKVINELDVFKKVMTGAENAGNSLITTFKTDFASMKEYSLWKITVIDNKIKNGEFLEEGKDASRHKMAAIGLHPALVGTFDNNGLGGAGSNIREAYNLMSFANKAKQDILLEPLKLVRDFNGWNKRLQFRLINNFMTTLDAGTEAKTK